MFRKPFFWAALAVVSMAASLLALRLFPQAFPIVQLELTMDRRAALDAARGLMEANRLGPADYRQAASFALDSEAQTFVELEGGGKDAYARMLREGLYFAYTWRVRHFREGEKRETLIRFRPDGQPYGFVEQIAETDAGAALAPGEARTIAERGAPGWQVDLAPFTLVEQSQDVRTTGRVDHTFTYERPSPTLDEGRYRLRLVVTGDRLTEATHFIRIPEAFTRRYEEMRSANQAIGTASAVALVLVYGVGGIAIGLFFLLRQRWVISRPPIVWGMVIAGLQVLVSINDWPLMWMTYDTAVPRASFIGQRLAILGASFVGLSLVFALSFMAAESLSRRAFGHHPQFWRVWSRTAGATTTILGHTLSGFLLVGIFFAYDVLLYFYATRLFGWWTPSEALLHPDVLASYVPWFSAIANSLQAGFWEEALFRAVPIAGAALIGDRFGMRGPFIIVAFVVQSIVFGAGHAAYPTQPSYARPVELILPSIGFGLLYLRFGLLPGIVLHYTFDVIWFALPLFVSTASGIWIDRAMVIVLTLVPLWVVFTRRVQAGAWVELRPDDRNAAWTPPPAPVAAGHVAEARVDVTAVQPGFVRGWAIVGVLAAVAWVAVAPFRTGVPPIEASRADAERAAREALARRGFTPGPAWRVMAVPDDGRSEGHRFAWDVAGEERFRALLGRYLATPRWRVRVATFDGDVADRAEEWTVLVNAHGVVERVGHQLPESRPGPSLAEADARARAQAAIHEVLGLAPSALRHVSAQPSKLAARVDWTFTFADQTVEPIPMNEDGTLASSEAAAGASAEAGARGEARIEVEIAGDEVVRVRPFLHVPEAWQRLERGRETTAQIVRILSTGLAAGMLVAAAILGIVGWSRGQFAPRIFVALFGLVFAASLISAVNGWPSLVAGFSTAQPFQLQVMMLAGLGLVGLLIPSAMMALAAGAMPGWMPVRRRILPSQVAILGAAIGVTGAAALAVGQRAAGPPWPDVDALGSVVPIVAGALGGVSPLLVRSVVLMAILAGVDHFTRGWRVRRVAFGLLLIVAGAVLSGIPATHGIAWWLMSATIGGAALLVAYVGLLRYDLSIAPLALGTMLALSQVQTGMQAGHPDALAGSIAGALLTTLTAWWLFTLLRTARDKTS